MKQKGLSILPLLAVFVLTLFFSTTTVSAGTVNVDRTWSDHNNEYGYALVTYTNDTGKTFKAAVTIKCIALDAAGNKLGVNTRSFFCDEYGPIPPGFEDTLEIPIKLHGKKMHHVKCKCIEK